MLAMLPSELQRYLLLEKIRLCKLEKGAGLGDGNTPFPPHVLLSETPHRQSREGNKHFENGNQAQPVHLSKAADWELRHRRSSIRKRGDTGAATQGAL